MSPGAVTYLLGFGLGLIVGLCYTYLLNDNWKHQAIRRGYAEYHPKTGIWRWKDDTKP